MAVKHPIFNFFVVISLIVWIVVVGLWIYGNASGDPKLSAPKAKGFEVTITRPGLLIAFEHNTRESKGWRGVWGFRVQDGRQIGADGRPVMVRSILIIYAQLLAMASLLPLIWLFRYFRARSLAQERLAAGLCPACGYDIRSSQDRCPECGSPIAQQQPATPLPPKSSSL